MCRRILVAVLVLAACLSARGGEVVDTNIKVASVSRTVELKSQLARFFDSFVFSNTGNEEASSVHVAYESEFGANVAIVTARVGKKRARVSGPFEHENGVLYRITASIAAGEDVQVEVAAVLTHSIQPFPKEISQTEAQLVRFAGNHYVFSPYQSASQETKVILASTRTESISRLEPTNQMGDTVTYGPYTDVAPLSFDRMTVHFESNSAFLVVTHLHRSIEVSHWGNVAVEDMVDVTNDGAAIKGPFSRFDFQRNPAASGVAAGKSWTTLLPASASGVYYRDEIGNVTTSNLWARDDAVEVTLRPRFPLFGGWKTHYVLGYNLPSHEFLFSTPEQYALKIPFMSHLFEDSVVDHTEVRITLPEGATNINTKTPFKLDSEARDVVFTYLDYSGRPVVVLRKTNLVPEHIKDMQITYEFSSVLMLREPLMIVGALYFLFLLVVIFVRLDFSLSKSSAAYLANDRRMRVTGVVARLATVQSSRKAAAVKFWGAVAEFRVSKDKAALADAKKVVDAAFGRAGTQTLALAKEAEALNRETGEAFRAIGDKVRVLKDILSQEYALHLAFLEKRMDKGAYLTQERRLKQQAADAVAEIDSQMASL